MKIDFDRSGSDRLSSSVDRTDNPTGETLLRESDLVLFGERSDVAILAENREQDLGASFGALARTRARSSAADDRKRFTGFLPDFLLPCGRLISVRSVVQLYPGPLIQGITPQAFALAGFFFGLLSQRKQLTILLIGCRFSACLLVEESPDGSEAFAVIPSLRLIEERERNG